MARTNAAALARLDRDRRALRLRAQGMPWAEVARECQYASAHAALVAVQRLLKRETHTDVETSRALQRERLELLMRSLWLAAINPGMARKAAQDAKQPPPPDQEKAIELLRKLLDDLSGIEGTKAPAKIAGPTGGPIEGRVDVIHWRPDEAWMTQYARVLREAGLLDDGSIEGDAKLLSEGPVEGDAEPPAE
jgi:hypothetical protein